jgi:hypothetical protein
MRKVVAAVFVSLDGVMQAPGGPEEDLSGGFKFGGWTAPYWDDATGAEIGEEFSTPSPFCSAAGPTASQLGNQVRRDAFARHPLVEEQQVARYRRGARGARAEAHLQLPEQPPRLAPALGPPQQALWE